MDRKEIGWTLVESADHELIPAGPWLEFHGDRLPGRPRPAAVLARNGTGVQAFRHGRHLAFQFHPEVDGPQLKRWLDAGGSTDAEGLGLDPDQFLADTIREKPAWRRERADRLVRRGAPYLARHLLRDVTIEDNPEAEQTLSPGCPGRPKTAVIVACMTANGLASAANASPWHTTRVRPALTTWPVIVNCSPAAGASRLTVNVTVSTVGLRAPSCCTPRSRALCPGPRSPPRRAGTRAAG